MLDFCVLGVGQSCIGTWVNSASASTSYDQQMFFTALMGMHGGSRAKLGPEGDAELLWENLFRRLQR